MFWDKMVFMLFCVVAADWHQDVFYQEMNKFRHSPLAYRQEHDIPVQCTAPLDETYPPLQVVKKLENSSYFQALTMSSRDCPVVSHDTCAIYCSQFGGCSFQERADWFLQGVQYHNALEIMIMGPKNPLKIFHHFLNSEAHCDHILNCHINSMGASFAHTDKNIFVADFAYIEI